MKLHELEKVIATPYIVLDICDATGDVMATREISSYRGRRIICAEHADDDVLYVTTKNGILNIALRL